eukprot:45161_1
MAVPHYHGVFILFYLLSSIGLCSDDYYCWEESERVVLKFANNESKAMTQLPTVRLIQGFYASQFAMQYAAFVYLAEKMGVDVEFYPENNPNALWIKYKDYPGWCEYMNPLNLSNITCSDAAPYPEFYFEDIGNDKYDLLFEIWDIIGVRDGMYIEEDIITNGGMSGVFGEGGWFIPKYMYENNPSWILPNNLKYNESLRQIFIDAYTINSDRNYIERWWDGWASDIDTYLEKGYGVPNYSQPIVWGSSPGYEISSHSNNLVHNLLGGIGINWTFAAFGSEGNLTAFLKDLYANELPFIAAIYSPHEDFAITLPNHTDYMQFERIALPRNPDNNPAHACYVAGQCTFPLSPLLKMGNPKLLAEFDEMDRFLAEFRMSTDDVNLIMGYHSEAASYNLTDHERWINATCKWLKQAEATTNEWHQNITRYDCIFNDIEESGCGFNYYYSSFEDATNERNAISVAYDDSIAGTCSYNTYEPLCDCTNDYFIGSTCRGSCPAVIGPMLNSNDNADSNESFVVAVGNYSFYLCSGHGECDIRTKRCNCQPGFGGDGCEIVFQEFEYQSSFVVLWLALFGFLMCLLIVSGVWVYTNKHYKTIRALSPNLTLLFTFGLILLCIGTVLYIFHPMSDSLCSARIFFHGIGAILTIMAPLCKTYRVAIIFAQSKNLKRIVLPDKKLMVYIIYGVVMETIICVIYTIFHQVNGGVEKIYLAEYERIEYKCNTAETSSYIYAANYLYIFTLIIILCFFSFKNRATHKVFKESRCAFFGSFFSLFVFLVVFIFNLVVIDSNVIVTIQNGAMFISVCVIWVLFYGVRMYAFFMYPEERSTVTITPSNRSTRRDTTQVSVWEPSSRVSSSEYNNEASASKNKSPANKRGSQGMPGYINELYDQRGMQSPVKKKTGVKVVPSAVNKSAVEPAMIHPQNNKIAPAASRQLLDKSDAEA